MRAQRTNSAAYRVMLTPASVCDRIAPTSVRIQMIAMASLTLLSCIGLCNLCTKLRKLTCRTSTPPTGLEPVMQHLRAVDIGQGIPYVNYTPETIIMLGTVHGRRQHSLGTMGSAADTD